MKEARACVMFWGLVTQKSLNDITILPPSPKEFKTASFFFIMVHFSQSLMLGNQWLWAL